jgi:NDP-sugar pyrophosphorylase family protein
MKALLICPAQRPEVSLLSERLPLAAVPMLGHNLVEYWASDLALQGVKEVLILAPDRSETIQAVCGNGTRWGVNIEVIAEWREITPAEALLRYADRFECVPPNRCVAVLDHFPGFAQQPLFVSYATWFRALRMWLPKARSPDRLGIRELQPGVFAGLHARISRESELHPPCWIGRNVIIRQGAVVGPQSVIEDDAFIEPGAEIRSSYVGPGTYVGRYIELRDAIAWGNVLVDWGTGSRIDIPDPFILSDLRPARSRKNNGWWSRLSSKYAWKRKDITGQEVT